MNKGFGILLVSTGPFANAVLSYADRLLGHPSECFALELNEADHWKEALIQVEEAVNRFSDFEEGVLILVEIMGGTPYNISKELKKKHKVEVIGGVNLPMVIKAMQVAKSMDLAKASKYLESYGREHILRCERI